MIQAKVKNITIKIFCIAFCLRTIAGAATTAGIHLYFKFQTFIITRGIGFLVVKTTSKPITSFEKGPVDFGCLSNLVGLGVMVSDQFIFCGNLKIGLAVVLSSAHRGVRL